MQNNGMDDLTVAANGSFAFATLLPNGAAYDATIFTLPTDQPCTRTYGASAVNGANVTNIDVICGPAFVGAFTAAADMSSARYYHHSATVLPSGEVLVAGGGDLASEFQASAELYDTVADTWTATVDMAINRSRHTATLLPNGRVLIAGGYTSSVGVTSVARVDVYDPATGTWSATGNMLADRYYHTATLLPNGKVLVAGGYSFSAGLTSVASAELYDPATGIWTATGNMVTDRYEHVATLLPNGKVLVAGGISDSAGMSVASAELYDPATGTWTTTGNMTSDRFDHTSTMLPDGKVLVAGGTANSTGGGLASAELYDPALGTWTATGNMTTDRYYHTATLLPNGQVLVTSGRSDLGGILTSAELYDPATSTWAATVNMASDRYAPAAVRLHDGRVLVMGGYSNSVGVRADTELYW